ncbi:nucleoprotein TPR isoform X2 [Anthonomus grandis grandis]|uniref:nucleoprotein TPR isoform X2 n=1 Tax=Anthonomus grandis grandis TaxID=2921223 RepID=UPI002165181A|nr:nucleoprotein TPR isoform X2 [Anthonomus grandis grandis]
MESFVFESVLSLAEWETVPAEIGKKISVFVSEKFDELITSKALLETKSSNSDKRCTDLSDQNKTFLSENESLTARLEAAAASISELENQVSTMSADVIRLQTQANQLEEEAARFRQERNLAVNERDEHVKLLQRRTFEMERMQMDLNTLEKQLEDAVKAKCEALANADEVKSMKLTLEYKEKRLEQEKSLMNSNIENLTEELRQRTDELLNMRRDTTSRCVQLDIKLAEKTQELIVANEQLKAVTELNENLTQRNEELSQKIFNLSEEQAKVNQTYICEIEAKTKMMNSYKDMYESSQKHVEELQAALKEVQELLAESTEKYGELETKLKESELMNEEIIAKKNDCIAMLKKELETANQVLEQFKDDSLGRHMEGLSSSVASMTRTTHTGMTYTEVYSRYVSVNDQLASKEEECARLNNYISSIVREIEEKGPLIKQLRQEYSDALDAIETLKESNDALLTELTELREANSVNKRMEGQVARENQKMKKEIADLSRQVVHLLQEIEHSRVGSSSASTDNDMSDSVSSAEIISKRLVTFNDISELQATNQKLLAIVRELTERQEEVESFDPSAVANLQRKLEELRNQQSELLQEREQQTKMMASLRNQREMYKNLYTQAMKGAGDMPMPSETFNDPESGDASKKSSDGELNMHSDEKVQELQLQVDKHKKLVDQLKEEYETYRKERLEHEKMLLEQLKTLRNEAKDLVVQNTKLTSRAELNEERIRVLQNNVEVFKKQITALEKKNQISSESIIKHEQMADYLKDQAIESQTRASELEIKMANLEKENAVLKDVERRLVREMDMLKENVQQQSVIQSNVELIKATLDRNNAESKLRLEAKLDEAYLECSSLRRRLGEEQAHFRELSTHLNKQTKQAQERMEEEKQASDKLRKEVAELREELMNKTTYIEDLSMKLKSSVFNIPDSSDDGRKLRELEQQLADAQAEINSLKTRLKNTKTASEEYFDIAQNSEKQLKEVLDKEQGYLNEIERQKQCVRELQDKCAELEGELSIQMDDQDIANSSIKNKSQKLQEELNVKSLDLRAAREQLENAISDIKNLNEQLKAAENKYAREITLHSADLQALVDVKAELEAAVSQVKNLEAERDRAVFALKENAESAEAQQRLLNEDREKLQERLENLNNQNSLLLDQIQEINNTLTILQTKVSSDNLNKSSQNTSLAETSLNQSLIEDEMKGSEQLLKIIKYLRQEKDMAIGKADIIEAEHVRLKSQFEVVSQQLQEAKVQIEAERQKTEVTNLSAAKHAEILRKLETLNAITDSNRILRQERDELLGVITELRNRADKLETDLAPLQDRNIDLMAKADQMQTENISLRAECTRWRQRANQLIEKTNRTSPEDWKKLQGERETLAKLLTVERGNTAKLTDENNNLKQSVQKLEDQLKSLRAQNNAQSEENGKLKEQVARLQSELTQITEQLEQQNQNNAKLTEEVRVLTEDIAAKDVAISELRNNLAQVKKIAKKYKTQCEGQIKDIESLRQANEQSQSEQTESTEKQNKLLEQQRAEHEEKVNQLETSHKESIEDLNQQVTSSQDQIETLKKEVESLKQASQEKEEKFKTLFKNAKERIMSLTEQNTSLKEELGKAEKSGGSREPSVADGEMGNTELEEQVIVLRQEKSDLEEKLQQEKTEYTSEIEALKQTISQLERKLGQQQGSKPSTSSASSDKSSTERPTADIKPIPGHSTNTQTQSVPIQPWRSGGEPPLASIRPMSQQVRTAAVLPTTQTPSAVMVPPQQQVHTTGSSSIEALSSSPTSSHTDYVPATSSASPMMGPRQVAVPPTQSTEDDDSNVQAQPAPQQQTLAVVSPRVEPPSSGTQEQGTSSSSSNTVTTTQAGHKRQREPDDSSQAEEKNQSKQHSKRTRVQLQAGTISDSGLEVEYQVPTSSQRDQDDDVVIVESDDDAGPDEGDGDDQEEPDDTESYDMEGMEQDNYEDADCQDVEDEEEGGNEVDVIDDSSEVPNQSEPQAAEEEIEQQAQSEAISSGTDATAGPSSSDISARAPVMHTTPYSRSRLVPPLPSYRQQLDESALDDGIVPSTPTLFAPRRSDGFGEAVSSPHVPSSATGRFTFNDAPLANVPPTRSEPPVPEHSLEVPQADDNSTGRSVPTTPLQSSPQESIPSVVDDQRDRQTTQSSDAEIPQIMISPDEDQATEGSSEEVMGPPGQAGTSSEEPRQHEEAEGDDGVSSEGEKQPSLEEGEEEGREAEASPSPVEVRRPTRSSGPSARRSVRMSPASRGSRVGGPTPIVWGDQRQMSPQRQMHGGRGQAGFSGNRSAPRRPRRMQRPYGRF